MIIKEGFGNYYYGNLLIKNYPNLQSIIVKKNSLQKLNSLKIWNCEKLKNIEIEDDKKYFDEVLLAKIFGKDLNYFGAFYNVKNVIIESNPINFYFIFLSS